MHPGPSRRVCNILDKVLAGAVLLAAALAHGEDLRYELDYRFRLDPDAEQAAVTITLRQPRNLLRIVRFRHKPEWHSGFDGDGEVAVAADTVTWRPPASGGGGTRPGLGPLRGGGRQGVASLHLLAFVRT